MDNHVIQEWVANTAWRLQQQAALAADLPLAEKAEYLETVVERRLLELPPVLRQEAVGHLMAAMPGVEIRLRVSVDQGPFGAMPAAMRSLTDVTEDLVDLWRRSSPDQQARCLTLLALAGIFLEGGAAEASDARLATLRPGDYERTALKADILRARLGMDDGEAPPPLDLHQIFATLKVLTDFSLEVEDITGTVREIWTSLCRSAGLENRLSLGIAGQVSREALRDSLENGDGGALDAAVKGQRHQKNAVRALLALAAGLAHGGRQFSHELVRFLSPEAIMEEVRKAGGVNAERCWKRYEHLCNKLTPGEIEYRLTRAIVDSADGMLSAGQA